MTSPASGKTLSVSLAGTACHDVDGDGEGGSGERGTSGSGTGGHGPGN
jgi:hypothetical protein